MSYFIQLAVGPHRAKTSVIPRKRSRSQARATPDEGPIQPRQSPQLTHPPNRCHSEPGAKPGEEPAVLNRSRFQPCRRAEPNKIL